MRISGVAEEEGHQSVGNLVKIIGRVGKEDRYKEIENSLDASWAAGYFQQVQRETLYFWSRNW